MFNFSENSCPCGSSRGRALFLSSDFNFGTSSDSAEIRRCRDCSSVYPSKFPVFNSIGLAYENYYTLTGRSGLVFGFFSRVSRFLRRSYLRAHIASPPHSLVDYGCGSGDFLLDVRRRFHGTRLLGVDIVKPVLLASDDSISWISTSDFMTSLYDFSAFTARHSLEHVSDPVSLLDSVCARLDSGGSIFISTPNARSFLISSFGRFSRDIDFPRHRVIFSRSALVRIFQDRGFQVEFYSPPKLNSVFNFFSCSRNVLKARGFDFMLIIPRLVFSFVFVVLYIFLAWGFLERLVSPEIVLRASRR